MPYAIKDLDDKCIFIYACLQQASENGGNFNVSSVANSLKVNKIWGSKLLAEAKKLTKARLADTQGNDTVANNDEAATHDKIEGSKKRTATGTGKRADKENFPRAKKVKVEEESEVAKETGEVGASADAGAI